jgi:hypothetical protein
MPSTEGEMGLTIEEYDISSIVLDGGSYRDHWAVGVGGLGFWWTARVKVFGCWQG